MQAVQCTGWFAELLQPHTPPCVSIYFPTQRAKPPAAENYRRFRDLVSRAQRELDDKFEARQVKAVLGRLNEIPPEQFGPGARDAMAVFASVDHLHVIDLQKAVDDLVVVADSFHVKPLIRTMQFGDRFAVLCFSLKGVRVLEGNQYGLQQVEVKDLPRTIEEASLRENLQANSGGRGAGAPAPLHPESPAEHQLMRVEHFMRLVDQRVWDNYARERHLPIVLVADAQHCADFLSVCKNPYVLDRGITLDPDHVSLDRLRAEAWTLIEPRYQEEIRRLTDQFRVAKSHQKGSDVLPQVAEAVAVGRVGTLLVDADQHIPGMLHRTTGLIEQPDRHDGRTEDVLDDLAEMVLKMDGQVYVLSHDQMPTDHGVAAMYRY
jgi:hypothetical protein